MEETSASVFHVIVWIGAGFTLLGLVGLIWCIVSIWRARRSGVSDEEMREVMRQFLPRNMAALFLSVIGLMLVVVGVMLA